MNPDSRVGDTSMLIFGWGVIYYVSQYLTFISSLEAAKVYSQTGWAGFSPWIRHCVL